ncbi:hypothetical protein [Brevibacillus sp. NRS-1366]|uniref:hypothetical protein n=1 Tax=Brevibacillus sp. NRS-1366 TaxID=3233899 RepID=UPI003D19EC4A
MKPMRSTMAILLGASILAIAPIASASPSQSISLVVAADDFADKLNKLPPGAKRIVTEASEFFGLTHVKIITEGYHPESWNLILENLAENAEKSGNAPTSIHMIISGKNGKVLRLDTYWNQKKSTPAPNKIEAIKKAADFTDHLFGQSMSASTDATLGPNDFFTLPLYPISNGIPVQKAVATVTVDPFGHILSFMRTQEDVDQRNLPTATGLLSPEQVKKLIAKDLQVDLVFNVEQDMFQYIPKYRSWFDAKTGEASLPMYDSKEEISTIATASQAKKALSSEDVKQMGDTYFGLNKEKLTISTSRESHPDIPPKRTYTLKDGTSEILVKVDEKSDSLISVSQLSGNPNQSSELTSLEDAKQQALHFIENYAPIATDKYVVQEKKSLTAYVELGIYPMHGEIRANSPYVTVTVDLQRNVITSVEAKTYPMPTAATPAVISKVEAINVLVNALDVELAYIYPNDLGQQSTSPKLVYLPTSVMKNISVDATSGTLIRQNQ